MTPNNTNEQLLELKIRAYHEAGHAVAAHVLGLQILSISIESDSVADGRLELVKPFGSTTPRIWRYSYLREYVERHAMALAAGRFATLHIEGVIPEEIEMRSLSDDITLRQDTFDAFSSDDDLWLSKMNQADNDVLDRRMRLAKAYADWISVRAKALINYPPHKAAIEALAEMLIERKNLGGGTVHDFLAQKLAKRKHSD